MAISTLSIEYPLILFAPSIGSVVSQVSFDIRDFIPGGVKPDLSMLSPGYLLGDAGTIRFNPPPGPGSPPDDTLGVNGDWIVMYDGASGAVYEKIDGHYVAASSSPPTVEFAYQGWRAVGSVVGGRWVVAFNTSLHIPGHVPCEIRATSTGDISY